jgi:hypothetical protein
LILLGYVALHLHPALTSAWHCGHTYDGTAFSSQACVIYQSGTTQPAMIVRNRTSALRAIHAAAPWELDWQGNMFTDYLCPDSAIGANDYSVCFAAAKAVNPTSVVYGYGDGVDGVTGADIAPPEEPYVP